MKKTFAIPASATRASPTGASPWTTWTRPAGAPASSNTRATHSPVSGVSSDGFSTTPFPAATAVATSVNGIPNGMFHGVIAATTPNGSYTSHAFFVFRCSCEKLTRSSASTRVALRASHAA